MPASLNLSNSAKMCCFQLLTGLCDVGIEHFKASGDTPNRKIIKNDYSGVSKCRLGSLWIISVFPSPKSPVLVLHTSQSHSVSIKYQLVLCVGEERRCRISAPYWGWEVCPCAEWDYFMSFEWLEVSAGVDSITRVLLLSERSGSPPLRFRGFLVAGSRS